jgi:hypothetical protein
MAYLRRQLQDLGERPTMAEWDTGATDRTWGVSHGVARAAWEEIRDSDAPAHESR